MADGDIKHTMTGRDITPATNDTTLLKEKVYGIDFQKRLEEKRIDLNDFISTYSNAGMQSLNLTNAIRIINKMIEDRYESKEEISPDDSMRKTFGPFPLNIPKLTIFLGCTSNQISSGNREVIRFLIQNSLVDCLVTTAGGVEEDLIKCFAPTYLGSFELEGKKLREAGVNRIGNLLIANDNYCVFEDWIMPLLDKCLLEQEEKGKKWTPSKLCNYLGEKINDESSVLYWAHKNNIPVFCPALTDGSIGDMLYFHSLRQTINNKPSIQIDIVEDLVHVNEMAKWSHKTGMIIVGGGVIKHHICNANLMRNGADYTVYLNIASEYDGSDSGARPDEAVSWGKVRENSESVKLFGEATILFPMIVAQTFFRYLADKR